MWDRASISRDLLDRAKQIKLIAADLDGTLLRSPREVTDRTLRAIEAVGGRGIAFTICTGRSFYELGDLPKTLGLAAPVICRNGAEIVDPADGGSLFRRPIPAEDTKAFIRYCLARGIDFCVTTQDSALYPKGSALAAWFGELGPGRDGGPTVALIDEYAGQPAYKIVLLTHQPKYAQARAFADRLPGIRTVGAADEIDDLIAAQANKGDGLRWVAEYLGAGWDGCCAFGDYDNDLEMLRYAGLSFAMENAPDYIKSEADCVAPSNLEDGVAQVLEGLFL